MSRIPLLLLVAALAPAPALAASPSPGAASTLSAWTVDLAHGGDAGAGALGALGARAWQVTFDAAPVAAERPARRL
ncbi:MAG: hypothetical protein AB7N90_01820, partial [Vicinamibacterales bacterium]